MISGDDIYGGTNRYFQKCLSKQNITVSFVDMTDIQNIVHAIQPNTKVRLINIYIYTYIILYSGQFLSIF